MIEGNGVLSLVDGDHASLDWETAFGGGRFLGRATDDAQQQ